MNFPYQTKRDQNNQQYIEVPFSYNSYNITIRIYNGKIIAKGIDEQILFYISKFINFECPNITYKKTKNYIDFFFEHEESCFNIRIKNVNNRLFIKLYKDEILIKRTFCYINKENKQIYQNSAYIVLKHLLNHKDIEKYNIIKNSNKEIYIDNSKNKESFLISIFNKDIVKMEYTLDGSKTVMYSYTEKSLYYINNLEIFDFCLGVYDVNIKEIEKLKLLDKLNKF